MWRFPVMKGWLTTFLEYIEVCCGCQELYCQYRYHAMPAGRLLHIFHAVSKEVLIVIGILEIQWSDLL